MLSRLPTRCKHCKERFTAEERGMRIHPACIDDFLAALKAKKERVQERERKAKQRVERAVDRRKREELKRISELIADAQFHFNAFIRERDRQAGHPCISSGRVLNWSGNAVDAGHYRSTGAASHLRFDEDNCHAQSKHDNKWLAGNAVDYRIALIARIGLERVEALENNNQVHKWTRDELIAIKALYVGKLKQLKGAT
ncbi:hypothetical protein ABIC89_001046 [Variovorax boronicumulans]|uniref:recombination protein NinG n=1 Tax=Variovorax boronicumulans TaxID=436515 RepID=UPI0033994D62